MANINNSWVNWNKLNLWSDDHKLTWSVRAGYPRITVLLNERNAVLGEKRDYSKVIIAPFTDNALETFIDLFKKVVNMKESSTFYSLDHINTKWENGKKTDSTYVQAITKIGRDADGLVYIAVTENEKPEVIFTFTPDKWFRYYKNGVEITNKVVLSTLQAKSYLKLLEKLYTALIYREVNEVELKEIKKG